MYSFTMAEAGTSDDVWNWFCATREVRAAIDATEEVAAALAVLVHDTHWESDGVRALHRLIVSLQEGCEGVADALHVRAAELERVVVA